MSKDTKDIKAVVSSVEKSLRKTTKDEVVIVTADHVPEIESISTGILGLDIATGVGGWARGRWSQIYGAESSGKTLVTMQSIASAQRDGNVCAFIDAERTFNRKFAKSIGVDLDNLILVEAPTGEQVFETIGALISSGMVDLIIVDSVAALVPESEYKGEMDDLQVGAAARMIGKGLRKYNGALSNSDTAVVLINQLRDKMNAGLFEDPNVIPGGRALKFYSSLDVYLTSKGSKIVTNDKVEVGRDIPFLISKNKLATPYKRGRFKIFFSGGVLKDYEALNVVDNLIKEGEEFESIIIKGGGNHSFFDENGEEHSVRGADKAALFLRKNPKILKLIEKEILEILEAREEEVKRKAASEYSSKDMEEDNKEEE